MKNFDQMRKSHDKQMRRMQFVVKAFLAFVLMSMVLGALSNNSYAQSVERDTQTYYIGKYKNCTVEHVTFKAKSWTDSEHSMNIAICSTSSVTTEYQEGKVRRNTIIIDEENENARLKRLKQKALSKLTKEEIDALYKETK